MDHLKVNSVYRLGKMCFRMVVKELLVFVAAIFLACVQAFGQCEAITDTRGNFFDPDQPCAPVTVREFSLTYNFSSPQDPNNIEIVYQWNDPANTIDVVGIGNGLVAEEGNKRFSANRTMKYFSNDGNCAIQPIAYIRVNGQMCTSSVQTQSASFWQPDDRGNGRLSMTPETWDVCYNNPVVNARFVDNSEFNCNIIASPDKPNRENRYVQFVYGTNHNAASAIKGLSLNNGGTVPLTTATGALATSATRGTGALQITAAYFGPVDVIPLPADGPTSVSFPMSAPANAANLVGNRFEVTLFNWNVCNPWNGDPVNPNYEDAVVTRGYIEIVDAPAPDFITRAGAGLPPKQDFCIDENIFFDNATPNTASYEYAWEFYDDAAGTTLAGTSDETEPTFAFESGGQKLIRLTAINHAVQGSCEAVFEGYVNITPSLIARIGVTDLAGNNITPDFCQEPSAPLTDFDVRFTDISSGTVTPSTVRRWEFYDEQGNLVFEAPSGGGFSNTVLGPFDRVFTSVGIYSVRLRVRDNITGCESSDEVSVRVFEKPKPEFSATRVCVGSPTVIEDLSTLNPIAGEQIVSREWDVDYDGTTFSKDPALDNKVDFEYTYATAGTYQVALMVTTNTGTCSSLLVRDVNVDPMPVAAIASNVTSGCSMLSVDFTNLGVSGQSDVVEQFIWEVDEGAGFVTDSIQRPTDPGFSDVFTRGFTNTGSVNKDYHVRLRVVTVNGCESISTPISITVYPQPRSGFVSLNYSPFNDNCSPVSVNFQVDKQTQTLNPTDYTWRISDANGLVDEISTGTTSAFEYEFVNASRMVKDFYVTLRATLPSACYGDSTRTIRIAPLPSSDFVVDTLTYDCDRVLLRLDALQQGLSEYEWAIAINGAVVYASSDEGEDLEYEIIRSATTDQNVALSLKTTNLTNCQSPLTTKHLTVERLDDMKASFTVTPVEQTLPSSTVTIVNTSSAGPWEYHWDFGDGKTSTDAFVPSHTYETFGVYTITLRVSNNDCVQTVSKQVKINPIPPVLDFGYFPPSGCAPHTVTFINESKYADPTSYVWKFGKNQGSSRAVDPVYTYHEPGVYSVTLSATNLLGDTVSLTRELIIDVKENPVAQFAVYPTTPLNVPGEILYTDNRSQNATQYIWDFGDGTISEESEPQHLYTKEGKFTVSLIARNGNGCADTTTLVSGVTTVNHGRLLIPNAFIPNISGPGSGNIQNNEVFLPLVQKAAKFQMLIFNRWGELMFETTNPDVGWDGYHAGRLCPQDVYIYKITVEYENGRSVTRTGDVNLLR